MVYLISSVSVYLLDLARSRTSYGDRKNCSIRVYVPRTISVSIKKRPAASSVDSLSFSHVVGGGGRKALGTGWPTGVAYARRLTRHDGIWAKDCCDRLMATAAGEDRAEDAGWRAQDAGRKRALAALAALRGMRGAIMLMEWRQRMLFSWRRVRWQQGV